MEGSSLSQFTASSASHCSPSLMISYCISDGQKMKLSPTAWLLPLRLMPAR